MIMITPNEFLQFAQDMSLGSTKSTSSSSSSSLSHNNHGYTTTAAAATGLCVLNNLCSLIEQIHQLKAENSRLRAQLELDNHIDRFQQRFSFKDHHDERKDKHKETRSSTMISHDDKSKTLSPSSSLKMKSHTKANREQKGINYSHQNDDSSSITHIDHENSELIDNHSGLTPVVPTWNHWSKVRHALKFSLRRKHDYTTSPPLPHVDRQIPIISVSIESDDDHLQDNKYSKKKKKKILSANDIQQQPIIVEDSDQDDGSMHFVRAYHRRLLYGNDTPTSSSTEPQEVSSTNLRSNIDDEALLTRTQSKIARYRRKLRSKLDTVKRQFSDQNSATSIRLFPQSHGSTLDDIGSGLNHALLTAQLAPALTKSYQQKMREWESLQKSQFLVNYRRQSIIPKADIVSNSRKTSMVLINNETSMEPSVTTDNHPSAIEESNLELETHLITLSPILSPNQRSLIVHQWREIMTEEILLRHSHQYLQNKRILLQKLETNLKLLKMKIFCTNNVLKQQSMIDLRKCHPDDHFYLPQRCRSLQTLISAMPASWILAVQSAAYSDVLDGTSNKTTERAILFNKHFFDQLEQCKQDRYKFEQDAIKDLRLLNRLKINQKSISNENRTHPRFIAARGRLCKLTLLESSEFPQHFLPDPVIPLQTTISHIQSPPPSANIAPPLVLSTNELDSMNKTSVSSSDNTTKRSKRSRFDLKETFQRNRSMCAAQINSWLQRRRERHASVQRRQSAMESKESTSKIFGSPRLARFHRRIFKQQQQQQPLSSSPINHLSMPEKSLDDSDNRSQSELPVRIYFPPLSAPITRHVRIIDIDTIIGSHDDQDTDFEYSSNLTTPMINRKSSSSSSSSPLFQMPTAKERRESYATLSNIFNNRCL